MHEALDKSGFRVADLLGLHFTVGVGAQTLQPDMLVDFLAS